MGCMCHDGTPNESIARHLCAASCKRYDVKRASRCGDPATRAKCWLEHDYRAIAYGIGEYITKGEDSFVIPLHERLCRSKCSCCPNKQGVNFASIRHR